MDQPDTGGGSVVLSVPVKLQLQEGANTLTFSIDQNSAFASQLLCHVESDNRQDYAGDLDKIIVYQQG